MKKFFYIILLAFSVSSTAYASVAAIKNAGFIQANIWYSSDTFYAGDTIRVYTAIFNGSPSDLSGGVEFLDNNASIGRTDFNLLGSGQVMDVSVPWTATQGSHTMTARIIDASTSLHGGPKTPIILENAETGKSDMVVQIDPAVAAAQTQAAVASVAQVGTQAAGAVQGAIQAVSGVIPDPVKEGTAFGVGAIENLRTTLGQQLQIAQETKSKEIDALNATTTINNTSSPKEKTKQPTGIVGTISAGAEKPFDYVALAVLTVLRYFFQWGVVFYVVSLYLIYRFMKWSIEKIRDR